MLAFAIAPFVQLMHMIGRVDHHFMEFTCVLLVTWLGLRWFANTEDRVAAIGLGVALGLAPGFHNGLFVLQIPVLVCAGVLWLRGSQFSRFNLHALAVSLMLATLLIVVPSAPFREGMFQFGLLSGFHLYVAAFVSRDLSFLENVIEATAPFMLMQFRFNYFGLFALIVGTVLVVQRLATQHD